MFPHIYVEEEVLNHPISKSIYLRFPKAAIVPCKRYTEIFNRKKQNFRLQKQMPVLILAKKFKNHVLKTPEGYGIGGKHNYYFSHMLNCIFDCRYCFLQGMYNSANFVLFVNFEDFEEAIQEKINAEPTYFFSGYDCDSLALEPITHFIERFIPLFAREQRAFLELRTKSTNISFLKKTPPLQNVICAFTLSPKEIAKAYEHKAPSFSARLAALKTLEEKGWPIGLRFDPLLYIENFKAIYRDFFKEVFTTLQQESIHSITLGTFRLPKPFFKKMRKLYPNEKLLAIIDQQEDIVSYSKPLSEEMKSFCYEELLKYVSPEKIFSS